MRHLLTALVITTASIAQAADVVVYRCTGADGHISLQDSPCVASAIEERRVLRAPPVSSDTPSLVAPRPPQSRDNSTATPLDTAPAQRAPDPLWLCQRYDGQTFESSTGIPQRHWVPLWALDADPRAPASALDPQTIGRAGPLRPRPGRGTPTLQVSAMTLGTWVEDVCTPLSPAQICARRHSKLEGYGRRIFNAGQSEGDRLRDEQAALRAQIAAECG